LGVETDQVRKAGDCCCTRRAGLRQISGRWDYSNLGLPSRGESYFSYASIAHIAYTMPLSRNPSNPSAIRKTGKDKALGLHFKKIANSVILSFPDWSRRFLSLLCFPEFQKRLPCPRLCSISQLISFLRPARPFESSKTCLLTRLPFFLLHLHHPIPEYAFVQTSNKSRRRYNFVYSGIPR